MNFSIKPKTFLMVLITIIGLMLIANTVVLIIQTQVGRPILRILHFGEEQNIPTLYSSFTLFFAGVLLFIIGLAHKKISASGIPWFGLALIFTFLSLDEFAMIHERSIGPVRTLLDTSGYLFFAWVIPYGVGLLLLFAIYAKFLFRLPKRTLHLFLTSGFLFVLGAIGIEMIEGQVIATRGYGFVFQMCQTVEELLEMLGVALFIYALLDYMVKKFDSISISV